MGKRCSVLCITFGILLMLASGYLYLFNRALNREARNASIEMLTEIKTSIAYESPRPTQAPSPLYPVAEPCEYLGYLSIPALELELPVQADWDYQKLKKAPCRFSGSLWEDDLVIMAHNYDHHFGKLSTLSLGDSVYFIDAHGITSQFEVAATDILDPSAVEEVTESNYDLTLFTCTYGGKKRVTVFCARGIGQ